MNKHEELQQLEYVTKMLESHRDLMLTLTRDMSGIRTKYLEDLREFAKALKSVQSDLGMTIKNIYSSAQELKRAAAGTNELLQYAEAVKKIDSVLSDAVVQKILRLIKE